MPPLDLEKLTVIHYPDPRLKKPCEPVRVFDEHLAALAKRMGALMREHKGVGLAASQVGVMVRLFVMNVTDDPANDQVFINPQIRDLQGGKEDEEGCLSIPDVRVHVRRATRCRLVAQDLAGKPVELQGEDFVCRVWQHETDHLNGILMLDRMGPADRIATKKTLQELEAEYALHHPAKRSAKSGKPAKGRRK